MAPIHACAEMGNLSEVMRLVDRGVDSVHAKNSKGRTPLMVSALHGHVELVRFLLLCGSGIEARDEDSSTALMLASAHGRVCVVCDLLREGANARVTDRWGRTPLTLAAEHGHIDVVHRLLQLGADACHVNARGVGDGTTCLWMAALSDYDEVVRALLEAGADPTVADAEGRTPLDIAIEEGCNNCARLLQEWQRVYVLTKACRLHDAYVSITTTTTTTATTHTSDSHNMRSNSSSSSSSSSSTTTTTDSTKTNSSNSNRGDIHPPVPPWLRTRAHTYVHTSASSSPSVVASIDLPVVCTGDGVRRYRHQLHTVHQLHDTPQLSQVNHRGGSSSSSSSTIIILRTHDPSHCPQRPHHHHLPDPQQHQHHHHHHVALHTHDTHDDEVARDDNTCHADNCTPNPLREAGPEVEGALEADRSSQAEDGGDGGVACSGSGQCYAHGCGRGYERVEHGACACACVGEWAGGGAEGWGSGFENGCEEERHGGRVGCVVAHVVREFNAELLLELLDMMRKAPGW